MRRFTHLIALAAVSSVLILGACGEEDGQAVSGGTTTPPATSVPTDSTTPGAAQLAQINACDLLTDADAASISKDPEEKDLGAMAGATSVCQWSDSDKVPLEEGITFGIWIRPSQTVDEVSVRGTTKVTDGKVEGRKAKQVEENDGREGSCLLSFAVESGRVDISAESYGDTKKSCTALDKVSTIIEPKLPKA